MRRNWPFFKDSDWLILVFVHSAKPTAELENLAMSPSLSSPGLSYDTKFVHIGWELRSSLVGDTILGVQSEPACTWSQDTYILVVGCIKQNKDAVWSLVLLLVVLAQSARTHMIAYVCT